MRIVPAIDLIDGKCVRLYQGDFKQSTQVGEDPESQLKRFIQDGAELIHIVDLDGARIGEPVQYELISRLCSQSSIPVEVGGGIRNINSVEKYVNAGVSRIVLGTAALENMNFVEEALSRYPEHIVIGIDAKDGKVAVRGWETVSKIDFLEFAKQLADKGAKTIVFTDISRDGTMSGPNVEQLVQLLKKVDCHIVASGGISSNEDIKTLENIGITEAIVGKAIYEGRVSLQEDNR
ncbi:1-(5-phosphoribosyl)-5-[(5-phosphoribosylamino)methylideneamino]imidazole-4-carboxamide isomerase [Heyndrickxia acidicola]|uniref:1-(5-phosphoribosyl)-5-[(5-phosphoribosylamino)methylideneamino] imidazole-4-carboxamide isomerase n=1 Tax=Heyndrickxia acidicola TaxID=209389 RepID=A0ABU6MC67_9BACI|nr:1-(5-phosphoribosyl)-5-[(5-phosphoribosylamino)methylideneamino]imidazole-4-carboxamide isomerase [Heyndrickxia acidicola]MED1201606.1 1-(5-phosphoribosyl)-5-[(5-phosphoribosylamino)methylideneamino]imidazole-4-carboxamide isomerase [Heyndrickxia acidicola]